MTYLETIKSKNGQIYPEDPFSHGAAHLKFYTQKFCLSKSMLKEDSWNGTTDRQVQKFCHQIYKNTTVEVSWPVGPQNTKWLNNVMFFA